MRQNCHFVLYPCDIYRELAVFFGCQLYINEDFYSSKLIDEISAIFRLIYFLINFDEVLVNLDRIMRNYLFLHSKFTKKIPKNKFLSIELPKKGEVLAKATYKSYLSRNQIFYELLKNLLKK